MIYRDMWEAGFTIFPLMADKDDDGKPLGEKEAYKRPRSSGWQNTPHWSKEQLDFMEETGQFETGYGVSCQGLIVIDVDARNGGIESFEKLCKDVPEVEDAGFIVATGSGGGSRHLYFRAPVPSVALLQHVKGYDGVDFKSSGFVVGAGSMHASGNRYTTIGGHPDNIEEAPAALIDILRKPEYHRTEYNGGTMDVTEQDIAGMLEHVDPDCDHETWVRVGMAIHDATGGTAFNLWDDWSSRGSKYPDAETLESRWQSFGKASMPVTIGTLIHYAEEGGWKQSVTFEVDMAQFDEPADLLDTTEVDLLRPPGFVGEVCQWVNDQCRYPREHLAVGGTLVAMGNVVGLRFTDDLDGVTSNLFGFGVAHSGSGKEGIYGAFSSIMRAAGLAPAVYGMQKSEQEVIRNLIRHQPAFYSIDEFGIHLQKVINASKRGGASYLEALIGALMSAYSKADSYLQISGDVKEELKAGIRKDISQHQKAVENNEDPTGRRAAAAERLTLMLDQVDNGLDRPFLSIFGTTTPNTFDDLVTPDQAESGFIGRALVFREMDPNPRAKIPFKKRPMPSNMEMNIRSLVFGGEFEAQVDRIERYEDRIEIKTDPDAVEAMRRVYDEFWQFAEDQKEHTGLTAIPRRGYEMVGKVSLILGAPGGVRTIEHVRWAYSLVKRDVNEKLRLVVSNDQSYGTDKQLMAKITKIISKEHGETIGVIRNRLRQYKPEDVTKALQVMESNNIAEMVSEKNKKNGRKTKRWFFTG